MKIFITDCDHDSIDIEQKVARDAGATLELRQAHTEDEVIAGCAGAEALIVQYAPITGKVLDGLPTVRAVVRYGVGVDTIDLDAATARGVIVMNVPDYGTEEVAEHAIALAMSTLRGVTALDRRMRQGHYDLDAVMPVPRISRSVFGILGLGAIGRDAAKFAEGLGFHVIGHDPYLPADADLDPAIERVSEEELLSRSDVISLHVPLTDTTRHMVNKRFLAAMKPTAILVNTCRGGVVDTEAIVDALRSHEIHAAALDVFETEPLPVASPLMALDNVVLTPHAAWYSGPAYEDLKRKAAEHVVGYLGGEAPKNVVNRKVLDAPESLR